MPEFHHMRIEEAEPHKRRVLEHVQRLVEGHDISLVGTIAANLMLDVIMFEVPEHDVEAADAFVDQLAAALKRSYRDCLARDREASQ
jgi:hypothetical protein